MQTCPRTDLQAFWASTHRRRGKLTFTCGRGTSLLKSWTGRTQWMPVVSCNFHFFHNLKFLLCSPSPKCATVHVRAIRDVQFLWMRTHKYVDAKMSESTHLLGETYQKHKQPRSSNHCLTLPRCGHTVCYCATICEQKYIHDDARITAHH